MDGSRPRFFLSPVDRPSFFPSERVCLLFPPPIVWVVLPPRPFFLLVMILALGDAAHVGFALLFPLFKVDELISFLDWAVWVACTTFAVVNRERVFVSSRQHHDGILSG